MYARDAASAVFYVIMLHFIVVKVTPDSDFLLDKPAFFSPCSGTHTTLTKCLNLDQLDQDGFFHARLQLV